MLLDEISAALDSVSEAALHSALERVLKVRQEVDLYVDYIIIYTICDAVAYIFLISSSSF